MITGGCGTPVEETVRSKVDSHRGPACPIRSPTPACSRSGARRHPPGPAPRRRAATPSNPTWRPRSGAVAARGTGAALAPRRHPGRAARTRQPDRGVHRLPLPPRGHRRVGCGRTGTMGALFSARAAGYSHVHLDGTLVRTDRCTAAGPTAKVDLCWSGKHHHHGGNVQVVTAPDGPLWTSEVRPGRDERDTTCARNHDGLLAALDHWTDHEHSALAEYVPM